MRAGNTLARVRKCAGSSEPWHARIQEFSSGGGGGPGQTDKKSSDNVFFFFFFFFFLAYSTEVKWSISRKSIIFQGSRRGPTFSRGGGVQLFPGGSNCL